jgi:hypothetical protein
MDDVGKEIEGGSELVGSVNAGRPLGRECWDSGLLHVDADGRKLDELAADVQPPDPCIYAFVRSFIHSFVHIIRRTRILIS